MTLTLLELTPGHPAWQDFLRLPERIYRQDPHWLRSGPEQGRALMLQSKYSPCLPLLALENNTPIARLIVRTSSGHPNTGLFGNFESVNDGGAAFRLLADRGVEWLAGLGVNTVVGPMDGDTWHKYRFNVGPFSSPPFLLEPYNPSYYPELWQRYGFSLLSRYFSRRIDDLEAALPQMARFYNRTLKNGFSYRPFRMVDFEAELAILHQLSCEIFADNFLYSDLDFAAFRDLYAGARAIIRPELIWFCQDKAGKYCGFVFALPDYFQAVKSMGGGRGIFAKLKFLLHKGGADTLNVKTVGTLPQYRGTGLGPALGYLAYRQGYALGFRRANMCLMHESNASLRLDGNQSRPFREYHLYCLDLPGKP
ncbi:MAG: hypothetical protein HGA96_16270 [Desulfobulbaceae bacterium]|nr:hypothetical protein [Desulfobulbaceae bacterium]